MHTRLYNLLILLFVSHLSGFNVIVPVSAKVFLSIDCGSSSLEPHTDTRSIVWVGDHPYVKTGEARNVVAKDIPDGWDSRVMSTLREFPTRKKNCYSIDVNNENSTNVERVLVRASFHYGNYDNKSHPPSFKLHFNGNEWAYVSTSMTGIVYKEVVYSLNQGNIITVCLSQIWRNVWPFISALEVRSMDSDMYSYVDSNYPLFFMSRFAYVGTKTIVRFPEDSYDRVWESRVTSAVYLLTVRNRSPSIKVDIADKIPEIIFKSAITSNGSSISERYLWFADKVTDSSVPIHLNVYFSEQIKLDSAQKRSINMSAVMHDGNGSISSVQKYGLVNPPYGQALQVRLIINVTVDSSHYEFYMRTTNDSTLPPLLNAREIFTIGDKLVQGTNSKDVNSLALLQKSFIQLQDWLGDPCLPSPYTWDWVACDSDTNSPRVIALYLNDSGLVGSLPDFSAMDALRFIDLHNNSLTQAIPDFLGTFPRLDVLNLADNNFSGAVPPSLLNNTDLSLVVSGNPNLSITNSTSVDRNSTESRIPSSSNIKSSITLTIPIVIFGSAIIQMFDKLFGLLLLS